MLIPEVDEGYCVIVVQDSVSISVDRRPVPLGIIVPFVPQPLHDDEDKVDGLTVWEVLE